MKRYKLMGLDCASCAVEIERLLRRDNELKGSSVDFATSSVTLDPEYVERARAIIAARFPEVRFSKGKDQTGESHAEKGRSIGFWPELLQEQGQALWRIGLALVLLLLGL